MITVQDLYEALGELIKNDMGHLTVFQAKDDEMNGLSHSFHPEVYWVKDYWEFVSESELTQYPDHFDADEVYSNYEKAIVI